MTVNETEMRRWFRRLWKRIRAGYLAQLAPRGVGSDWVFDPESCEWKNRRLSAEIRADADNDSIFRHFATPPPTARTITETRNERPAR